MKRVTRGRQAGLSLVELMVACAVGLLVALAVTTAVVSSSRQFTILSGNAEAQNNAQIGLALIEQAGRAAGAGFYSNGQRICPTWNAYNGSAKVADNVPFMPARIVAGAGAQASDTLVFTGGGGSRPLAAAPVLADVMGAGASIKISDTGAFQAGDYALIGAPGSNQPCTLFEVRGTPAVVASCGGNAPQCQEVVRTPNQGLNPVAAGPDAFTTTPNFGFAEDTTGPGVTGPAVVSRVGSTASGFRQDAFSVRCEALVRYNAFDFVPPAGGAAWCSSSPLSFTAGLEAIASDIVLLQAQYGLSASAASNVVTQWVEPSGAWAGTPAVDDIPRIKAVRVVMVARSREPDGQQVSAPCTNGAGVANTGPCSFEDAAAPVIDLSALPAPAGRSWRNFRYRVHTAVIPLRTVIWSGS